jgi:hypothetical protein
MQDHGPRIALFVLACVALAVVAIGSGDGGEADTSTTTVSLSPEPPAASSIPAGSQLEPRPFLRAFLRYEVGELDPGLRRRLRARATPAFARQLFSSPIRVPPQRTAPARLERLSITHLSRLPPRALVSGTALRAGKPEQFSFLFEAPRGTWLASGPAE